jgi:uncharacterized protein YggU (UPF0235/DUF167 family)
MKLAPTREGHVRFEVQASPRARRSALAGVREGVLLVRLAASPVDGAANEELVGLLARALSVPRRRVSVVHGGSARRKLIDVCGLTVDEVRSRLACSPG